MSNVAALNFKKDLADAEVIAAQRRADAQDATASSILNFGKRELKSAQIEGVGIVYFYDPPSFAETYPYLRSLHEEDNTASMGGLVDSIIATIRDAAGRQVLTTKDREKLLELPPTRVAAIWAAIGDKRVKSPAELVRGAEKN